MNFDTLFALAKDKGIEDIQVYFAGATDFNIEVMNTNLEKYTISDTMRLAAKGLYNGKMGTVSTEVINEDIFPFLVDSIIASANAISSEDEVFIYEGDKEYKELDYLYNDSLDQVSAAQKIADAKTLEELIKAQDERIIMVQAMYGDGNNVVRIENSKGLRLKKEVNSAFLGAVIIAKEGDEQRTAIEYKMTNDYNTFDLNQLAKDGAKRALALLGSSPVASGEYEIVLENSASCSLLAPHMSMFSANSVQKGVSLLKGKIGESIGSSLVTLVDDPFLPTSSRSGAFDDEGVATKYKELISEGTLTGFLHNLKTAKIDNTKSTGNGFNGIRPTNFYLKAGTKSKDELVKSMKKGLLITGLDGTHAGCNPVNGDFSLQASGFLVEDGEIIRPVNLITVAGNYLTLLQDVIAVADDLKFNFMFVGSPSLRIKSLQVSGT